MGKFIIFVALLLFVYEVQPVPLSRLRRLAKLRHARQAKEVVAEADPIVEEIAIEPATTLGFPPSDPTDACGGCPKGEVCQEVYPPCARPPWECEYLDKYADPDTKIMCEDFSNNYNCRPISICMDAKYAG